MLAVKNPLTSAGDAREAGSIPGSRRWPRIGNGNPFQYSCLENPMDRRVWWLQSMRLQRVRRDAWWSTWFNRSNWWLLSSFNSSYVFCACLRLLITNVSFACINSDCPNQQGTLFLKIHIICLIPQYSFAQSSRARLQATSYDSCTPSLSPELVNFIVFV